MRIIIFREGEDWVAQGLEFDICVQSKSLDDIVKLFDVTVLLEECEDGGVDRILPAPKHFFNLWNERSGNFIPVMDNNINYEYGIKA